MRYRVEPLAAPTVTNRLVGTEEGSFGGGSVSPSAVGAPSEKFGSGLPFSRTWT